MGRRSPGQPIVHGENRGYQAHRARGEEPCAECSAAHTAYNNDWHWSHGRKRRVPAECGTINAYRRHIYRGEAPCDSCREASRAYETTLRRRRGMRSRAEMPSAACGTRSGYNRHLRLNETPCEACRAANRAEPRLKAAAQARVLVAQAHRGEYRAALAATGEQSKAYTAVRVAHLDEYRTHYLALLAELTAGREAVV